MGDGRQLQMTKLNIDITSGKKNPTCKQVGQNRPWRVYALKPIAVLALLGIRGDSKYAQGGICSQLYLMQALCQYKKTN